MSIIRRVRSLVRNFLLRCGIDARRLVTIARDEETRYLKQWQPLVRFNPSMVLDIGANVGQFARLIRQLCPNIELICFEPLPQCQSCLQDELSKLGGEYTIHRCALGDEPATTVMHLNEFSPSSSLLPLGAAHVSEWPFASRTTEQQVTVRRLDDVVADSPMPLPFVAKIDVQGFEAAVIRGGQSTLRQASAVVVECSTYGLYSGQPSFDDVNNLMRELGFTFRGILDQATSCHDCRILQFDALFEK